MPIQFSCPHCGNATEVSDQYAGQSGPCAKCGATINIPHSSTTSGGGAKPAPPAKKGGSGLVIALVAVAGFLGVGCLCSGVLVALLLPAVQAAREAARRSSCGNNHKQIALGFHNHHDTYNFLPNNTFDDGAEMHSWRTRILPFLEQQNLYDEINQEKAWDSPENTFAVDVDLDIYKCPSKPMSMGVSDYVSIYASPETRPQPILTKGKNVRFMDITDGTSNTIMVVETASGVQWISVNDLNFDTMPIGINTGPGAQDISSLHPGGAQVSLADGSIRFIADTIDPEVLKMLITRDGGEIAPAY